MIVPYIIQCPLNKFTRPLYFPSLLKCLVVSLCHLSVCLSASILFTPQCPFLSPSLLISLYRRHLYSRIIIVLVITVVIVILGLGSTSDHEHVIFAFLNLACLAQHDDLQSIHFLYD
jgi:hypothetical protein